MTSSGNPSLASLLFLNFGIPVNESLNMISTWLKNHPEKSQETLIMLFNSGRIIVKDRKLQEISELSPAKAKTWAEKIQQDQRLVIKDRWYRLKCYKKCFIGSELVDYLQQNHGFVLEEAISIGQDLWKYDLIAHVCNDHGFSNGFLFYRFSN